MKLQDLDRNNVKPAQTFKQMKNVINAFLSATIMLVVITFIIGSGKDSVSQTAAPFLIIAVIVGLAIAALIAGVVTARKAVNEYKPQQLVTAGAMFESAVLFGLILVILGNYSPIIIIPFAIVSVLLNLMMLPRSHPRDAEIDQQNI